MFGIAMGGEEDGGEENGKFALDCFGASQSRMEI